MRKVREHISTSLESTLAWAIQFGQSLSPGTVLALRGDLGAGKTTLMKGIVQGLLNIDPREVTSPTFTYLNIYQETVYHFDLYRLKKSEEFLALGFSEFLNESPFCCIEWPERIEELLPSKTINISLSYRGENQRGIVVETV